MTLSPGSRLGTYEVIAPIGAGGMGEVFRARDTRLNRDVAIKVLPTSAASDPERRERFEREAQAVAALNHPNIVTIYSVEQIDGQFLLAMELVEGRSLDQLIPAQGLPLDRLLQIAILVADAVAAAHQKGITHRDLKPANIMLGEGDHAGRVKVLDFGLAKLAEAQASAVDVTAIPTTPITGEGRIVGTVAYMSPEQAEGKSIDARSDLFSLGVILYEMATGQRPFGGDTSISIISSIIKDTPTSITELRPGVPRDLGRIVRRALLKDPERRYQTAKDLRSDLEELRASLESGELAAPVAASTPAAPVAPRPVRRRSTIVAAAAIAALAVAGAVYVLSVRSPQSAAPTSASAPFSLDDLQITQLTTSGNAERPAISADGKYVAYVQRDSDAYSLWIRQTATSSNVQIVAPEPGIFLVDPTVTPDGNYVDFVRGGAQSRVMELWRVPFLGGTPKRVVENLSSTVGWSSDGRRMAFIRADIGANVISTALVVAGPDGRDERVVTTRRVPAFFPSLANGRLPVRPAWSADDASIAVLGRDGTGGETRWQIVLIDVTSGAERILAVDGEPQSLGWLTADSLVIARRTDAGTPRQLWRYTVGDGKMSRLTNDLNDYTGFGLSADRSSLVTAQSETQVKLWIGDGSGAQGSEPLPASRGGGALAWAADRLVYVSQVNRVPTLRILAPGRAAPADIVAKARTPSVTADGRTIVFVSADSGSDRGLWKVGVDGSRPVHLWPEEVSWPVVTSGDRQVVFLSDKSGQQSLWTIPIEGGTPVQVSPVFAGQPEVAPNGTSLLFGSFDDQRRPVLMLCELPDCVPRQMALPMNYGGPHRWMPGGRAIAYGDRTRRNLWVQPLDGGTPRQLTHFTDGPTIADVAWSRDGKRLAISRSTTTNDIVLFTGLKR